MEAELPVMREMWDTWDRLRAGRDTSAAPLPWSNETGELRQFLAVVMYEGARLAAPNCQDLLSDCQHLKHNNIFTEKGICLEISPGGVSIKI